MSGPSAAPPTSQPILEVIACSVADAVEAERGGASRLEIISDFARDGMTPPFDLVRQIIDSVSIPVRVMIRETESFTVVDGSTVESLCQSAAALADLPINGLVLGFMLDGRVDLDLTRHVLSHAPKLKATFHHAFEHVDDPFRAIEDLKRCDQIDRILTMGGQGSWPQKIERLGDYQRAAAPEITILAGGGLNANVIQQIRASTAIREFHVGRSVRDRGDVNGVVQASLVRDIISRFRSA